MLRRVLRFCRHLLLALLLLTVLVIVLGGTAAWLWRLPLAGWAAERGAAANGLPLSLTIVELDLGHATATDILVGPGLSIASARVDYRPGALVDGTVDRVVIDGLDVQATLGDGGVEIPALDGLGGAGDGGDGTLPPLPPIRLTNLRVALATPQGTVELAGDLDVRGDDGIAVAGDLTARLGDNRLAGRIDARRAPDGRLAGDLALAGGALAKAGIAATLGESRLSGSWNPATEALPRLDGHIALAGLTLPAITLGASTLDLASDGDQATVRLVTATADAGLRLDATLTVRDALAAPTVTLAAGLDIASLAGFTDATARGRVDIAAFAAPAALTELPALADLPAEATVRLDLADVAVPGRLTDGTVAATLRLATTETGAVTVILDQPAQFAGAVPEPLRVTLQPTDQPLATVTPADRSAAGRLAATVAMAQGDATIAADYTMAPDGDGWRLSLPTLGADAARLTLPQATANDVSFAARDAAIRIADTPAASAASARLRVGRWTAGDMHGDAAVEAAGLAWSPAAFSATATITAGASGPQVEAARLTADVTATGTPDGFAVTLPTCALLAVRRIANAAAGGPLRVCQGDVPALRHDGGTRLALRLQPSRWQVSAGTPLDVSLAALDLAASLADGAWTARLTGQNSGLEATDLKIGLEEIDVDVTLDGLRRGSARLDIGWLRDRSAAPRFMPMKLAATATLHGDTVNAEGLLQDRGEQAAVKLAARHDLASGTGEARAVTDPPIAFAKGGAQPQRLVPLLRGKLLSVDGIVNAEATAQWGDGPLQSAATLEVTALGGQTPVAVLAGLDGKVVFTSLLPPATAPRQTLTLASLDVGLPLTDGTATLTLRPDGKLALHTLGWPWAGGRIHVEDEVIDPAAETIALTLRVDDVDLAELVKLTKNEELVVTGRVGGTIPVEVVGDTVFVRQAKLASTGPGTLRYGSEAGAAVLATGGEGSALLASALKDFRYDSLLLALDGETTGQLDLAIQVRGFSPEVYSGAPVELNFSVGGALLEMIRQGLAGYRIPDNIVRQLRGETDDQPTDEARPASPAGAGDASAPGRVLRPDGQARSP